MRSHVSGRLLTRQPLTKADVQAMLGCVDEGGPLLAGRSLVCPSCEEGQDVLAYRPLDIVAKYERQLVAVLKCPRCRFLFALHPNPNDDP